MKTINLESKPEVDDKFIELQKKVVSNLNKEETINIIKGLLIIAGVLLITLVLTFRLV